MDEEKDSRHSLLEKELECSQHYLNSRDEEIGNCPSINEINHNQKFEKWKDYNKLYKKFQLLNLNNNEENLNLLTKEFFGSKSLVKENKNLKHKKDNNFNLIKSKQISESKIENMQQNYVNKFLKTLKEGKIKEILNCQFCFCSKISSLSLKKIEAKYKTTIESYNIKVINDIIYNENSNIVCIFKDYLIYDDTSEFLKRFYKISESNPRLPKIFSFYHLQNKLLPSIYNLHEGRITNKYRKKEETKNEEKNDNLDQNQKIKFSRNIFGDDDKIFNTKFLEELNKAESFNNCLMMKSNNLDLSKANKISDSYIKDLQKYSEKNENLVKEEFNLNNLLYQFCESNSKILNPISLDSIVNPSFEKRNSEIITEMENCKDNPALDSNILKRNPSLKVKLNFKASRAALTNKEEPQNKLYINNKINLHQQNFQTHSGKEEKVNTNRNEQMNIRRKTFADIILNSKKNSIDRFSLNTKNSNLNNLPKEIDFKNIKNSIGNQHLINSQEKNQMGSLNIIPQKKNCVNFENKRISLNLNNDLQKRIDNPFVFQQANTKQRINLVKQKSQPNLKIREIMNKKEILQRKNSQPKSKNSTSRPIQNHNNEVYKNINNNNKFINPVISVNFHQNDFLQIRPALTIKNQSTFPSNYSNKNIIYKANNLKKRQISNLQTIPIDIKDLRMNRITNKKQNGHLENIAFLSKFDNSKGFTNLFNSPSNSNQKISLINNLFISNNFYGASKRHSIPINKKATIF